MFSKDSLWLLGVLVALGKKNSSLLRKVVSSPLTKKNPELEKKNPQIFQQFLKRSPASKENEGK